MDFVFLHGAAQGGWVWSDLISAMRLQAGAELGRTLALDAPGCGAKRGRSTANFDAEAIALELISDIERSGLERAVLVGHSQAGTEIPLMLRIRPEIFSRVVYVACVAPAQGKTLHNFKEELYPPESLFARWDNIKDMMRFLMTNDMKDAEADVFIEKLGADHWPASTYAKHDWVYDEAPASTPATYVLTLQDNGVPQAMQEIFASRLKAERLVRIDCGHQAMNSRPHALAEIILREAALSPA